MRRVLLRHDRALGDVIAMTALPRDIALCCPGEFEIGVQTSCPDLWRFNPYIKHWSKTQAAQKGTIEFKLDYGPGIREHGKSTIHFMSYFHMLFNKEFGTAVSPQLPYPDLHLAVTESPRIIDGRYWVFISGGKSDMPAKVWRPGYWQETVDRLAELGIPCVRVGSTDQGRPKNWHPPIQNIAVDLLGKTNLRDLMRLVRDADGVICGITGLMHMAAALQRPCVCIAGGREAWWWEAYVTENRGLRCPEKLQVPHRYLHTIGLLDCCRHKGCWRSKTVPMDKSEAASSLCVLPVMDPVLPVPKCLDMITPDRVITAVLSYYLDGTLQPIPGSKITSA